MAGRKSYLGPPEALFAVMAGRNFNLELQDAVSEPLLLEAPWLRKLWA